MFTGIVSAVGTVRAAPASARLRVEEPRTAAELMPGASVAVNGCCLTAVEVDSESFAADLGAETLARTNLGAVAAGHAVNLELPLSFNAPLGGHLVQGHVDATAQVLKVVPVQSGQELSFELPPELAPFVAEKGSIAVDGVSLTVAFVVDGVFGAALIPHTLEHTIAGTYRRGSVVNLEVDLVARYLARLAGARIR